MSYIIYNGKASNDILDSELLLYNMEYSESVTGIEKEYITTEITENSDFAHYLGAKYSTPLEFKFTLLKKDNTEFSTTDIRLVQKWLINNSTPKKMVLVSDNDDSQDYYFMGVFTLIEKVRKTGVIGLTCTFRNNSAYLYQDKTITLNNISTGDYSFSCLSDDTEHWILPVVTITATETDYGFTITNKDNNNEQFKIHLQKNNTLTIDNRYSIIKDKANVDVSFTDMGWNSVSDISWLKVKSGKNTWNITTKGKVTISIKYSSKVFGGVLDEFTT